MTKLPKKTLDNIYFAEIKALLKENKAISGFKEYFREQVQSSLEDNDEFEKEDFDDIKDEISILEPYFKIFKSEFSNKCFPVKIAKYLYFWQSLEDFNNLWNNIQVKLILNILEEKKIWYITTICKNQNDFEKLCKYATNDNLRYIDKNLIKFLTDLYKTVDEFLVILNNPNVAQLLRSIPDNNIELIIKLCKTPLEFEYLYENKNIKTILSNPLTKVLHYLISFLEIKTGLEFEQLISNDYIRRISEESNLETLKLIVDFLDIDKTNFNIFSFNNDILELSINIDSDILAYLLDLYEVKKWINGISNLNKFASIYSHIARSLKPQWFDIIKIFDKDIQRQIISEVYASEPLNRLGNDFDLVINHKYWPEFRFFIIWPKYWAHLTYYENFPVNSSNFLDFMQDDDTLFEFEETWTKFTWTKPWTKAWFMEKPERIDYVNSFDLEDFNKFWLIPWDWNKAISNFSTKNLDLWEELAEFVDKKISPSKHNTKVFIENKIPPSDNFNKLFAYYLKNKQNALVSMMEKMNFIQEFGLDIDISKFKTLDDFIDEDWNIKREELKENFEKILKINNENKQAKLLNQFDNFVYWENIKGLEKLLMDNLIKYFDYIYYKKIKVKVISTMKSSLWSQNIDFNSIDNAKLDRAEFIEAYKMSLNPSYNKRQINKLLLDYLTWKFDNLEDLNQYKTSRNIDWLDRNLSKEQQEIWHSKNRKEILLEDEIDGNNEDVSWNENIESRINNHIENIIKDISQLNEFWFEFEINFENKWELKKYFNTVMKKQEEEIKSKIGDSNLYEDLKFQMNAISKLETQNSSQYAKKSSSIIIEKELDPINSLMMWNWVDNSCLSFYSNVWNYYSAISNTIDANKWVYYIRNENWVLLGRCLITIWSDKKLSRYKMYYSGKVDDPIDEYFDEYTKDLAKRLWLELNWDQDNVRNIESDFWYKDGIKKINY